MTTDAFLAKQTTTSIGTDLTLIAAETGYRDFIDTHNIAGMSFMGLLKAADNAWEVGVFTVVTVTPYVVSRAVTPIDSSNGGASITLSTGTHTLKACAYPAKLLPGLTGWIDFGGALFYNIHADPLDELNTDPTTTVIDLTSSKYNVINIVLNMLNSTALSIASYPWQGGIGQMRLIIKQDATGGHVLTFPVTWTATGNSPALVTTANAINIVDAFTVDDGANWIYVVK